MEKMSENWILTCSKSIAKNLNVSEIKSILAIDVGKEDLFINFARFLRDEAFPHGTKLRLTDSRRITPGVRKLSPLEAVRSYPKSDLLLMVHPPENNNEYADIMDHFSGKFVIFIGRMWPHLMYRILRKPFWDQIFFGPNI